MFCATLYVAISYYLTGNYYEPFRFFYFLLMCLLATICAQSWGFFIGATMPVKVSLYRPFTLYIAMAQSNDIRIFDELRINFSESLTEPIPTQGTKR